MGWVRDACRRIVDVYTNAKRRNPMRKSLEEDQSIVSYYIACCPNPKWRDQQKAGISIGLHLN